MGPFITMAPRSSLQKVRQAATCSCTVGEIQEGGGGEGGEAGGETTTTPHSSRAPSRPRTTPATKQRRRDETQIYIYIYKNMYSAPPAILGSSLPVTRSLMSSQCCWRGVGRQRARVRTGVRRGPNAPPLRCRGHERSASACGQGAINGECFGPYFSTSRNQDYIKPHRTRAGVHHARPVRGGHPHGL